MDMREYRDRHSADKDRLSWNKVDFAAVGCVALMGVGVVLTGLI
jgi:energy-coupling factor transport system permease protein